MRRKLIPGKFDWTLWAWTIWFICNSLLVVFSPVSLNLWPVLYNFFSLMAIFYAILPVAKKYSRKLSYSAFKTLSTLKRMQYLFLKREVYFGIIYMIVYILAGWLADQYLFSRNYPYFFHYCIGRFFTAFLYVLFSVGLALFWEYARRRDLQDQVKDERIISLQEYLSRKNCEQDEALNKIFSHLGLSDSESKKTSNL